MAKLVIDVDMTLCATDKHWFEYLQAMSMYSNQGCSFNEFVEKCLDEHGIVSYNLGLYFSDLSSKESFSFWKNPKLYENVVVYPSAAEVLSELGQDNQIVFASICNPEHLDSKYDMLKRTFRGKIPKENMGFMSTKDKHMIGGDFIVDDRLSNINPCSYDKTVAVWFDTFYTQDVCTQRGIDFFSDNWNDIGNFIKETL